MRGFTFLELIVVVGIIGVAAAFVFSSNDDEIDINRLVLEAEKAANKYIDLIIEARSSQSTVRLDCRQYNMSAYFYRGRKSNSLYSYSYTGINGAANLANGSYTKGISVWSLPFNGSIMADCPSGLHYITSDGNIVSNQSMPYVLKFFSKINRNILVKLEVSSLGYPRIFIQDSRIKNSFTEVIR